MGISLRFNQWRWRWPARNPDERIGISMYIAGVLIGTVFTVASLIYFDWSRLISALVVFFLSLGMMLWDTRWFKLPYRIMQPVWVWVAPAILFSITYSVAYAQWDSHRTAAYTTCGPKDTKTGLSQCCTVRLRMYEQIQEHTDDNFNLSCKITTLFDAVPVVETFIHNPTWLWKWPLAEDYQERPLSVTVGGATIEPVYSDDKKPQPDVSIEYPKPEPPK